MLPRPFLFALALGLVSLLVPVPSASSAAAPDPGITIISIERSVVINRAPKRVFAYAADFLNDPAWRAEVNTMTVDGPRRLGAIYTEDSTLGLQQHGVTLTELTDWEPRRLAAAETLPTSPYYLRSQRTFERIGPKRTRLTYLLEYDAAMAHAVFGFPVPAPLVEDGLRRDHAGLPHQAAQSLGVRPRVNW